MAGEVEDRRFRKLLEDVFDGSVVTLKVWLIRVAEGDEMGVRGSLNDLLQFVFDLG